MKRQAKGPSRHIFLSQIFVMTSCKNSMALQKNHTLKNCRRSATIHFRKVLWPRHCLYYTICRNLMALSHRTWRSASQVPKVFSSSMNRVERILNNKFSNISKACWKACLFFFSMHSFMPPTPGRFTGDLGRIWGTHFLVAKAEVAVLRSFRFALHTTLHHRMSDYPDTANCYRI